MNFILQARPKRVALIDDNGKIKKVFPSQTDAAICTDTDQSGISKVCRGLKKDIKGKHFITIDEKTYKRNIKGNQNER